MSRTDKENIFSTGTQKLLCFPEKLQAWLKGEPFVPVTLEIQPTERCNHRCPQCEGVLSLSGGQVRKQAREGVDLDLRLLESVWDDPPDGVIVSGHTGDPLMHPHIVELLERLARVDTLVALLTNGEAMTEEIAQLAVRMCTGIRVSVDACDPESFRRTHGVGEDSWKRVMHGIKLLVRAKADAGILREDCTLGIGYLTDEQNKAGMLRATRLAKELGVDYIQFRPFHYRASSIESELKACMALEEPERFSVMSSAQKYNLLDSSGRNYAACYGSFFFTVIDARGDYYICEHHVKQQDAKIGSLSEMSWQEFIVSDRRKQVAKAFPKDYCIPFCRLNTHNAFLQGILENETIPYSTLPEEVQRHAVFL